MLLEEGTVSRKTPLDGKLEITPGAAERLEAVGGALTVSALGREAPARLDAMPCTCAKSAGTPHVHHFLESALLRELTPESTVRVMLDASRGVVTVEPRQ